MSLTVPLLWLYGPSGVGKSAVGWAVFRSSSVAPVSYVDIDQLGLCYPRPADDPDGLRLIARNLRAVCAVHVAAGARRIVVSGGGPEVPELLRTAELSGVRPVLCRLRADPGDLAERIRRRGWAVQLTDAALRAAAELDAAGGTVLDTTGRSVAEVAAAVPVITAAEPSTSDRAPLEPVVGEIDAPVLWLSGAPAVGKSSVGFAVFSRLAGAGEPTAYLDLAQLGFHRPETGNHRIAAAAVAACWPAFRAAGATRLVLTGAGGPVPGPRTTTIRLHANAETLRRRVFARGAGTGPPIPGDELRDLPPDALHARATEAARIAAHLEHTVGAEFRIDTDDATVAELTDTVLDVWQRAPGE